MSNALAALARRRLLRFARSALVSDRMGLEHLVLIIDQQQGAVVVLPDTKIPVYS